MIRLCVQVKGDDGLGFRVSDGMQVMFREGRNVIEGLMEVCFVVGVQILDLLFFICLIWVFNFFDFVLYEKYYI